MQALPAPITANILKANVQCPVLSFQIYHSGAWVDLTSLGGVNYLKNFSLSLGGASMTPNPVAGSWSATIHNPDGIFLPMNPDGTYNDYFATGVKVNIQFGINYGGTDYTWSRIRGVIDSPEFSITPPEVRLKGMDFCQYLADHKFRSPNNYWGSSAIISTIGPVETLGAEIYAEADACEIGAGEANNVTNWAASLAALSSVADVGGGSTYAMKILFGSGSTVQTYATQGIWEWVCPAGVTSVQVECWGAGGGGGGNRSFYGAGGGGGGAYSKTAAITVVPGTTYIICVGEKGYGGDNDPVSNGIPGGDSWFGTTTTILAKGGSGGERGAGHNDGNGHGGAGGAAASGVGTTKYSGGAGGNGNEDYKGAGGGGGSSAGTAANGNDGAEGGVAVGGAGGAAPAGGGAGADGGDDESDGDDAAALGGAGGGSGWDGTTSSPYGYRGGDGYQGKVILTFTGSASTDSAVNTNVGAVVVDTAYKVTFKYKKVAGSEACQLACGAYIGSSRQGGVTGLSSGSYASATFYFTATDSGDLQLQFDITGAAAATEWRIDEISIKSVGSIVYTRNYAMPTGCTGIYYATLDGDPINYGEDPDGWFYDSIYNEFYFHPNRAVQAGTDNLVCYYHTAQIPEYVVADLLTSAGLYASRVAALAAMTYTPTYDPIDRVWFEAGTSALAAMCMICERCNYRFYFSYTGTPTFIPAPSIKAVGVEDCTLAECHIAEPRYYEESTEIYNRIVIDGENIAQPLGPAQTMATNYTGTDSDATSISIYGDRTLSIKNHLFQTDAECLAMATTLLALYKDPKKYLDFNARINALPIEIGDTIAVNLKISADGGYGGYYDEFIYDDGTLYDTAGIVLALRGMVRDIKINGTDAVYRLELGI